MGEHQTINNKTSAYKCCSKIILTKNELCDCAAFQQLPNRKWGFPLDFPSLYHVSGYNKIGSYYYLYVSYGAQTTTLMDGAIEGNCMYST